MAKNKLDVKKIRKSLEEIQSSAENALYREIHKSFVRGMNRKTNIESFLIKDPDDIYLRTMYEIVNSIELFAKKDDIIGSKSNNISTFLENAYRKTTVKPIKENYIAKYKKDDKKHIHFEGEITIEATEEEIKAMRTIFLGGDTTVYIDGVEEQLASESHMSHDRNISETVSRNMGDFLESRWDDIVKEIKKGEK